MLLRLDIENLAVIKNTTINFYEGMNVFTGETGAGKSVMLKAINFVLGNRCSKDMIRSGEKEASVTAIFSKLSEDIIKILTDELKIEIIDDKLIIKRYLFSDGKTTASINDVTINLQVLKKIGLKLIHFSEQNSNRNLLISENNLKMLDDFAEIDDLMTNYRSSFNKLNKIIKNLQQIENQIKIKNERLTELNEKISQIERVNFKPEEDQKIINELNLIKNSEAIFKVLSLIDNKFSGFDNFEGILNIFDIVIKNLDNISMHHEKIKVFYEKFKDMFFELQELILDVNNFKDNLNFDPVKLEILENRLSILSKLKRKFGPTLIDVENNLKNFKLELKSIQMNNSKREELIILKNKEIKIFKKLLLEISKKREKAAASLSTTISNELKFLEIIDAKFVVELKKHNANLNGAEDILFLISTNLGEPLKPVSKIASGGELSRIMLAIVSIMANKFKPATLVFDEIDSGVSGIAAKKIGLKLKDLSKNTQIICITHLAQIAAIADENFKIIKKNEQNRVISRVIHLDFTEKVGEIARLLDGDETNELTLKLAIEMVEKHEN